MRDKFSVSTEHGLHEKLKELSLITRISVSKLFDEAVLDLLEKHDFENAKIVYYKKKEEKEKSKPV